MTLFVVKRLLVGLLVVFLVTVAVFFLPRLLGDPVASMLPVDATQEQYDNLKQSLGWDRPIVVQFVDFLGGVVHLDFGNSISQGRPAFDVIAERAPATLVFAGAAVLLTIVVAVPLGIAAATRPNSILDRALINLALLGFSVPLFLVGLILILVFGVWLRVLPTSGAGGIQYLILPAVTIALTGFASLAMITRSSMIDELNQPWIRTARLKGLPFRRIVGVHALKNASAYVVTAIGLDIVSLLATGLVIAESVFAWPGLGSTVIAAIERRDLVLLQACVFCIAVAIVVVNIIIDIVYKVLDPRIDYSRKGAGA